MKTISDFPEYEIGVMGNVYNKKSGRLLKTQSNNGYRQIGLYKNKIQYSRLIHRLVLEAYVGPCPKNKECCHNNGNRADNRLSNLRWDTRNENAKDAMRHGTSVCLRVGENSIGHKLTEKNVINIIHLWNTKLFTQQEIANMYNMSREQIRKIINGESWKHMSL